MWQNTTGYVDYFDIVSYRLQKLTGDVIMQIEMRTVIKNLLLNKKKFSKRNANLMDISALSSQFSKMGRLGQQLVVMSR